jgi:hypothetical protein
MNKLYVTYYCRGSLLSSQFVEIWEYCSILECILLYSMETVLSLKASTLLVVSSTITILTSWLQGTNKLVTGSNHLITYLGQGILFFSHSVEIWEYWCNLEHYVVLWGESSKQYRLHNWYWHHPQLPYGEVGYREQSLDYIFGSLYCISPILCSFENICVFLSILL